MKHVKPPSLPAAAAFSHGVVAGQGKQILFIGGQNGIDESSTVVDGGTRGQTATALQNVAAVVEAAGGSISDLVMWTIAVTEDADLGEGFAAFGDFWEDGVEPPAISVLVVSRLAHPDWLVEVSGIAAF